MPGPLLPLVLGAAALLGVSLASRGTAKTAPKPTPPTPTPGAGTGGISGLGCPVGAADKGVANLPTAPVDYRSPVQAALVVPVALSNADALDALAAQLAGCGQTLAAAEVTARALAVRTAGGGGLGALPDLPVPVILPPGIGGTGSDVASPATYQWRYVVQADDTGTKIASRFFGNGAARNDAGIYRYVELIDRNAAANGTVGDRNNPNTKSDAAPFGYNFRRLNAGDRLFIPQSWNAWVTPNGKFKNGASPFPTGT